MADAPVPQPGASAPPRGTSVAFAYAALLVLVAAPICTVDTLPFLDLPNHMARQWILAANGTHPTLNASYTIQWGLFPNLAMDLLLPPVVRWCGVEMAARIFVVATFVLLTAGTLALHRALSRRASWWPLLAFTLLYSDVLLLGFTGYLFAVGVALCCAAAWVRLVGSRWLLPAGAVMAVVLMVGHLFALGIFALTIGGLALPAAFRARSVRPLLLPVAACVPALVLFAAASPTAGAAGRVAFATPGAALRGLASLWMLFDVSTQILVAGVVALAAASALWWRAFTVHVQARALLPLLALVFAAMPSQLFGSAYAQFRLPVAAVLVAIACTAPAPRAERFVLPVVLCGLIAHLSIVWPRFADADRTYARMDRALDLLPVGVRLATATFHPAGNELTFPPLAHHALRTVWTKDAFVPSLYSQSIHQQQPVRLTPAGEALLAHAPWAAFGPAAIARIAQEGPESAFNPFRSAVLDSFDALLVIRPGGFPFPPPDTLQVIDADADADFVLFRLTPRATR